MFTLHLPIISLASARRQLEALKRKLEVFKRKHARVIAAAVLKPVARRITHLWETAVENKQPVPDPIDCVHIVTDAGFRPITTWNVLHGYIDHCQRFRIVPDPDEIIAKLLPPREKVNLSSVLPKRFPARHAP